MVVLTSEIANTYVINPLRKAGFAVELVGGIKLNGHSNHDIDIVLTLSGHECEYNGEFDRFEEVMKFNGWEFTFTDEQEDYGIFHNYEKTIDNKLVGLDVFIKEVD